MAQASQALQSAQQSLQQAGQGTKMAQGQQSATDAEMGQEMGQSGQQGQSAGQGQGNGKNGSQSAGSQGGQKSSGKGAGMGGPGIGAGGHAGAQQPLPTPKHDVLVPGIKDPKGKQLSKVYMGTPDPNADRAAYYTVVPEKTRAAEASLGREDIPAGYKSAVKTYFESIQPGK